MDIPTEPPKRGRGRPKKEKTEEEKPKRPVGRPKKEKTEEDGKLKNPVGRPKKASAEKSESKRPVGRPKKVILTETTPAGGPATVVEIRPPPPTLDAPPQPAVVPTTEWADPEYVKFRKSFRSEEAYENWEDRVAEEDLRENRIASRWVTVANRRYQVQRHIFKDHPNLWNVYRHDWKNADKGKHPHSAGVKWLGHAGSGDFAELIYLLK
jgi:hypothetical protein